MAIDTLIDGTLENACRTAEANAIRAKTGGSTQIAYDFANGKGFADAIATIPTGGGSTPVLQTKSVTINANTAAGTPLEIASDGGYDGLEKVLATVAVPQGAVGIQSGTFKEDADFAGTKTITVNGLVDVFVLQCEDSMYAQNTYMQAMFAIRDASNTGQAAVYYGLRGSSSAIALTAASSTTVQFDNGSVIIVNIAGVNKYKGGSVYRWFAWTKEVAT